MARTSRKVLLVMAVAAFGVWGCGKGSPAATADRSRHLEAQVAELREGLKAAAAARDTHQAKLAAVEKQFQDAVARAVAAERDRDEAAARLAAKAVERDQVAAQFDGFRRRIKDVLGETEAALAPASKPDVAATPVSTHKPAGQPSGS